MSSATERFMTVYEERMRGGGQRAAEVADQIWSETRENLSADDLKAVRSLIGDIIVADIKRRNISSSEKLFAVLADCKHSEIVRVEDQPAIVDPPSTDAVDDTLFALLVVCPRFEFKLETTEPLMHQEMMHAQPKSWLHRLNYARSVVELQDSTQLTMTGLSDQFRLDTRRMRELIPLGRVLVVDPELAYRLVNSDIPWSAVKRYFSADRYMRIKDRLHEAWGTAKRPRPE